MYMFMYMYMRESRGRVVNDTDKGRGAHIKGANAAARAQCPGPEYVARRYKSEG